MRERAAAPATGRYSVKRRVVVRCRGELCIARRVATVARERVPVGRGDVLTGGGVRAPRGAAVGTSERLPVGGDDVLGGGEGRHLEVLQ